ncbi:MAG: hydroxymethylglutaryl-CoA synthase, partial [Promethearchaeota archaeon]
AVGTLAIINAIALIEKGVINKALVINADISSYKLGSPSEVTQGSGAVAFVISKNPRVFSFSKKFGKVSGNINDFFRSANEKNAEVYGHYSVNSYLNLQLMAYDDLTRQIGDFYADYYVFHAPFSKLPLKCIQQIILKRWLNNIHNILKKKKNQLKATIKKKIDSFLQNASLVPNFILAKLKEKGYSLPYINKITNWISKLVKTKVLPQLKVPMHFGNMYSASVWAQILYILENHADPNETIYFGSYGSGATCISGLLKIKENFLSVINKGPTINDYISNKIRMSVEEYELARTQLVKPMIYLGKIVEHQENNHKGFTLHFCDKGCFIPNIEGLNYCPKGHKGFHEKFFPYYAVLKSTPKLAYIKDLSFLNNGLVRIAPYAKKGNTLEYEIRRIELRDVEISETTGLLNWTPMYIPVRNIY